MLIVRCAAPFLQSHCCVSWHGTVGIGTIGTVAAQCMGVFGLNSGLPVACGTSDCMAATNARSCLPAGTRLHLPIHVHTHTRTCIHTRAPSCAPISPGAAPLIDSCGVAGGVHKGEGPAAAGGDYQNTTNAKLGDFGSALPPLTGVPETVWNAGEVVEVAWTMKAYHGGGYADHCVRGLVVLVRCKLLRAWLGG